MVCDMGVRIQREAGAVVAQHTGHRFHVGAGLQSQGRERMPQVRQMFINTKTERYKKPGSHRKKEFL